MNYLEDNKNNNVNSIYKEDGKTYGSITYAQYINLENEPSKPFIMIAELIDNSISSFENNFKNWTKENKLIIDIDFNFDSLVEVQSKVSPQLKYLEGSYISIKDNAFGFKKYDDPQATIVESLGSLIIYGQKNRGDSNKNKWGKGLKHCVYYFGQDLEIVTSNGHESATLKRIFTSDNIGMGTRYPYDAESIETIENGTEIIISNIYKGKEFGKSTFNTIIDALSRRYVNYIRDELIEVRFEIKSPDYNAKTTLVELEEPIRDLSLQQTANGESVFELLKIESYYKDFTEKITAEYNRRLISYSKLTPDDEAFVELEIFMKVYKDVKSLINKYIEEDSEKPIIYNTISFEMNDDLTGEKKDIDFDYWLLPLGTKDKFSGVRFYEGKRAIRHVCGNDKDIKPWKSYVIISDDSNRTSKKIAGSINLETISLSTVKDKSNFRIPESTENDLIRKIWSVYRAMEIFAIIIAKTDVKIEISEETYPITTKIVNDSVAMLNAITGEEVVYDENNSTENKFVVSRKISETDWNIEIKLDDTTKSKKKFYIEKVNDNHIKFVLYLRNAIWIEIRNNFKDKNAFMTDVLADRIQTLIKHSISITSFFVVNEKEITEKVVSILNELGEDYLGQNIQAKK